MTQGDSWLLGLTVVPLAFVQWGAVIWCFRSIRRFRNQRFKKLISCAALLAIFFGVLFAQIKIYEVLVGGPRPIHDSVVLSGVIILECAVCIFLMFYQAIKEKQEVKEHPTNR